MLQQSWFYLNSFEEYPHILIILKVAILLIIVWLIGYFIIKFMTGRLAWSRALLGVYLFSMLAFQTGIGVKVLGFRHTITRQLLDLREAIIRRNHQFPIERIYVIGTISPTDLASIRPDLVDPDPHLTLRVGVANRPNIGIDPAGRLRFILHSALPKVPQSDFETIDLLFDVPASQRLVIVVGNESRVSIADQSRLRLEPIHPGVANILTAFATSNAGEPQKGPKTAFYSQMNRLNQEYEIPKQQYPSPPNYAESRQNPPAQLIRLDDFTR